MFDPANPYAANPPTPATVYPGSGPNPRWFEKTGAVGLLFFCCWPVALYLMWKGQLWSKQTRWIITGILVLVNIGVLSNRDRQPETPKAAQPAAQTVDLSPALASCKQQATTFEAAAKSAGEKSAAAEQRVAQLAAEIALLQAENAKLKDTPEQRAAALVEKAAAVSTSSESDALIVEIDSFLGVYKSYPAGKQIVALRSSLIAKGKKFAAGEAKANAEAAISGIRGLLSSVSDGDLDPGSLATVASYIQANHLGYDALTRLPRAGFDDAVKDPEGERGKGFVVSGKIIQISRDGEYFVGLIGKGGYFGLDQKYYFVTPGTTRGIYEGKNATFAGIFTQRYEYELRAGGKSEALATVGYFRGQE